MKVLQTIIASCLLLLVLEANARSPPNSCDLPIVEGRCDAIIKRFAFFKDAGECREFNYGGCGGNGNNFQSLADCQAECPSTNISSTSARSTRDTPEVKMEEVSTTTETDTVASETKACEQSKCPQRFYLAHYQELTGCEPIYDAEDSCCPKRYDCSKRESLSTDKCHFNGKEYNVDEEVSEEDTPTCLVHCSCRASTPAPRIQCISIECPELFHGPLEDTNCVRTFTPGSCCSTGTYCHNKTEEAEAPKVATCEHNGTTYVQGQKFYPEEEPCMTCNCQPGFQGKLEEPFCKEVRCNLELHYASRLQRKCMPVYYTERCCPIEWRCPEDFKELVEEMPAEKSSPNNETDCVFGEHRFPLGSQLPAEIAGNCVRCSCEIPPVATCVKNYDHCDA